MTDESLETFGLRILEDISALLLHSHDMEETLGNIVALVAKRMGTDVCSIYLLEPDGETLTLQATKGLSRGSVGSVTMKTWEGLTGLVIQQRGTVAIENAPLHPRYKYFRGTKEERFHSFLGLPIMQRKAPIGVIVVQTKEPRTFLPKEISVLSTISSQISSIVINAKLLDSIRKKEEERAYFERELQKFRSGSSVQPADILPKAKKKGTAIMLGGSAVSPGFSIGRIYIINRFQTKGPEIEEARSRPEEIRRFQLALEKARIQTLYLEKRVAERLSQDDAAIFHTHLMILEDRGFIGRITDKIEAGLSTERAVREVVEHYVEAFSAMEDPYLRERSADMEDIGRRMIGCLDGNDPRAFKLRERRIIVAEEILPSDLATLDDEKILGIVTERGDVNSHAAIMAKSLGIPAVLGIEGLLKQVGAKDEMIVDGNSGHVFINPEPKIKNEYERIQAEFSIKKRELEELRDEPAQTADGERVYLRANIGLLSDIRVAHANGAEGVGLYRTEFPYMARSSFPHRNEQYTLYRKILEGFPNNPVNIRTLDIGGDKELPYFHGPREDNPFMGWRSIRVSLERQDIFREQLAAILMASPHGQATAMFPMVSGVDEIRQVKAILEEVKHELSREGHSYDHDMKIGIMIEVPAAVQTAHILIREVDYFSIGTNDLIQYTLAADRNNPKVKSYYNAHHPAVLHSIKRVADVAAAAGKRVSLCGEMAADAMNAILLLGMGIREFSLSGPYIPVVKQAMGKVTLQKAEEIARTALDLESASTVGAYLAEVRKELTLD